MVKCTLDGREIEVEAGTTILNAARAQSIDIPTFCYQDRLSISASCRMCLVEIEGRPKLEPACATAVAEDMVIHSHSEKVVGTREDMLEILLANHPLDCPVCDKGGECELQDTVFEYGKGDSRLRDPKRVFRTRDIELNQVIVFNANRCIQCQRCVRVCEEIVGDVALGTSERGLDSEITGVGNSLKDCSHCGNCIEVCPVGALMSIPYRYKARPWDLVETETICGMCGTGCSLTVETRDGEFRRVKSRYETGLNGELLCAKGRFGFDAIDGGTRISEPMLRKDGTLISVSLDEAIAFIAAKVSDIRGRGGHIRGQISPRQTNQAAYRFQKLMREVFGSGDIHSSSRFSSLRDAGTVRALARILGDPSQRKPLQTALSADCVLVLGSNVTDENPVTGYLIRASARDHGNRLFVASSRPCGLDDIAEASLRLLPGNEAHLLVTLLPEAPEPGSRDLAEFSSAAEAVLAQANSISLLIGTEFLRTSRAADVLHWLRAAMDHLKRQGKSVTVQFLFDRPNQLGLWDMGCLPGMTPGWQMSDGAETPAEHSPDLVYVLDADPLRDCSADDPCELAALNTDCLVVQASHMSRTAEQAQVVLPAPAHGEEAGSFTNNEGLTQDLRTVRAPPAGVFSTLKTLNLVSRAAQALLRPNGTGADRPEAVIEPQSYDDFCAEWKNRASDTADRWEGDPVATPSAEFSPALDSQSDLTRYLVTGDGPFHSGNFSSRSAVLSSLDGSPYIEMNPGADFEPGPRGLTATIKSGDSKLTARLKINPLLDEALVFVPECYLTSGTRKLTSCLEYPAQVEVLIE